MATYSLTDAEIFQRFLADQLATTGRNKSPEELVRLWRERRQEQAAALDAIQEGIDDMRADRVRAFTEVNDEIRGKHGWSSAE